MYIIHGDHQTASREFLLNTKKNLLSQNLNLVELSGSTLTQSILTSTVETNSLFGQANLVVLEDFLSTRRPGKEKTLITEYLLANSPKQILVWESKDVSTQIKSFPPTLIHKFDLPKTIFHYLETFSPQDLRLSLETSEPNQIFSLLVRQIQNLIMVQSGVTAGQPEWKINKLRLQASKFTPHQLFKFHSDLLDMDLKQKTSASSIDLAMALEIWSLKTVN